MDIARSYRTSTYVVHLNFHCCQSYHERPYRTWGYPITPAIYLAAFAAALVSLFLEKQTQTLAGCGLIAAGAVYYIVVTQVQRRNAVETR